MTAMLPKLRSLGWTGFPRRAALLAAALGLMVLAGWGLDVPLLRSALPGLTEMKANAALCFALLGVFQVFGEMEEEERRLLAERSTEQSRVCEQLMIGRG